MDKKVCSKCRKAKEVDEFAWRYKSRGVRQSACRKCHKVAMKKHYADNTDYYQRKARVRADAVRKRNREYTLAYLMKHPCIDCGEGDPLVLEFDHVRGKKVNNVCYLVLTAELEAVKKEIEKCEVRCANCHARRTSKTRGFWLSKHAPVAQ